MTAAITRPLELGIVLPTFNERGNIASMVQRLDNVLGDIGWEAIFVDDHSSDGTADVVREISRSNPRVRIIERIGRRGLAGAAIEGMCATSAPFVAVMDADHQHDPALLVPMLEALRSGDFDLAYASRFAEGASMAQWQRPDRERLSGIANDLARKLTGVELSDPMSGYFMLRSEDVRARAGRLSGIGFKILLDILATSEKPMRVKELPLDFAAREAGESKLDRVVAFEFLVGLYDKWLGRIIPTRFALFGTIGAMGVVVHMAVLYLFFQTIRVGADKAVFTEFAIGQTIAALVAMTFNFILNNALTYADQRLHGGWQLLKGWVRFALTCSVGLLANVGAGALLVEIGVQPYLAGLAGILIGSVWNYALSSRFVWGKFG